MTTTETNDKGKHWDDQLSDATSVYEALAKLHKDVLKATDAMSAFNPDWKDSVEQHHRVMALANMDVVKAWLSGVGEHWLDIVQTLEACLDYQTYTKPFWEVQP